MTVLTFPGAWYATAGIGGTYAVLYANDCVQTHLGRVAFPDGSMTFQPLYLRQSDVAGFSFAGQSWGTGRVVEWAGGWQLFDTVTPGTSSVIYDQHGTLCAVCNDGAGPEAGLSLAPLSQVGVNGYRYVNDQNRLITGDATYAPSPFAPALNEWTDLSEGADYLVVGQGNQVGGVVFWDGSQHRMLIAGDFRFIRAVRSGDQIALAFWGVNAPTSCYWLTRDEVRGLPVVGETPVPPTPIPPTPNPPEVPMILTADFVNTHPARVVLGQGANEHERRENALRFCNTVARDANRAEPATRYGLLEKTSGANAFGYAADIIFDYTTGNHFDVVKASEATDAAPAFQNHGPADRQRWRATDPRYYVGGPVDPPVPNPPTPQPPVPQPPVPGNPTNADILAAVTRLQASFDRVFR